MQHQPGASIILIHARIWIDRQGKGEGRAEIDLEMVHPGIAGAELRFHSGPGNRMRPIPRMEPVG